MPLISLSPHVQETVDAIVRASGLPLSILIVGVGDADYAMVGARLRERVRGFLG